RNDLALADRAAVVGTMVFVGEKPIPLPVNAELKVLDFEHAIVPILEFAQLADHDLVHCFTCSCRHSSRVRRYHICRSKKLRSAAGMIAQIAVTASVAFTGRSPNGGSSCWRSSHLAV